MADRYLPPVEFLRECFRYDPETGEMFWRQRPSHHFTREPDCDTWNATHAGTKALTTIDQDGYRRGEVRYEGRRVRARLSRVAYKIMTGEEPDQVDHADRDTGNNRWRNLRAATSLENSRNSAGRKRKLLPKGVFAEGRRFVASYSLNRRRVRIGAFDTPAEAHAAYCATVAPIHGEFFNPGPSKPSIFD